MTQDMHQRNIPQDIEIPVNRENESVEVETAPSHEGVTNSGTSQLIASISVADAAQSAGISKNYVMKLVRSGEISSIAHAGEMRIIKESLDTFISDRARRLEERRARLIQDRALAYTQTTTISNPQPAMFASIPAAMSNPGAPVSRSTEFIRQLSVFVVALVIGGSIFTLAHAAPRAAFTSNAQNMMASASETIGGLSHSIFADLARALNTNVNALFAGIVGTSNNTTTVRVDNGSEQLPVRVAVAPAAATSTSAVSITTPASAPAPVTQTIIQQPVIERIIQTPSVFSGVSQQSLTDQLQQLDNKLSSRMYGLSSANATTIAQNYNVTAQSNAINQLSNTTIKNPTIIGGSISGVTIASSGLTGTVSVNNGGTGTSTAPAYGQLLLGNAAGGYDLVATSSLGILSGGGGGSSVWGSFTGTLSDQTDLQAALDAKLSLTNWYATTTTALAEGSNLYFTNSRADTRVAAGIAATTTDALAQGSTNKYYSTNLFATDLAATTTTALAEGSNLYYTAARFNTALAGKSTTDLTEGSNLYFTNNRVASVIAATTTDALAQGTTNKYYSDTLARSALSSSATGLTYTSGTGIFTLTSGYTIPLTASSTEWATAYANRITSASLPLSITANAISISQASLSTDGYLSSADFNTFNNKFATTSTDYYLSTKSTSNLTEGSNLYFTNNRVAAVIAGTTTTALAEGSNLYFTNSRADVRVATGIAATTTTALAEGTNLYFTPNRVASVIAATTTDALAQGSTNKYYSTNLFAADLAATTTTALAEGSNLYYTDGRADARVAAGIAATTTTALAEGSNLYWTNIRFDNRLSATTTLPNLTTLANLASVGTITSGTWSGLFGAVSGANLTNLTAANIAAGTAGIDISGNAGTATKLAATKNINGVAFDGSADITISAASSTLLANDNTFSGINGFGILTATNATTTSLFSTTASSTNLFAQNASFGSISFTNTLGVSSGGTGVATLTGVAIGNGTSAFTAGTTQTCTNQFVRAMSAAYVATCNTVSLTADVTGTLAVGNGGTGVTSLGTGIATWWGTPSSANLAAALTDETGTGSVVFSASPTLTGTLTAAAANFSGLLTSSNASTSLLSVFSKAYFGGTATSSFDSTGNLTLAGLGNPAGKFLAIDPNGQVISTTTPSSVSLSAVNTWSALQLFQANASTTGLSVYGPAYFGATATSSFNSIGQLNLADNGASTSTFMTLGGMQFLSGSTTINIPGFGGANLFLGTNSGVANTAGFWNTGMGYGALQANTTGGLNTAVGTLALAQNTNGAGNTALGLSTLYNGTSTYYSTAIGSGAGNGGALYSAVGGTYIGYSAGNVIRTGSDYNTLIGYRAGAGLTTGSNNLILSTASSSASVNNITTGSQNILVGNNIGLPSSTGSGQLNIGNMIYGTGIFGVGQTVSAGNIGIGTSTPYSKFTVWGTGTGTGILSEWVNSASTTVARIFENGSSYFLGNVGIGTTTSATKLGVQDPVSSGQLALAYDTADSSIISTNSLGNLIVVPSGNNMFLPNTNLWVCTGGSISSSACPSGTPTGQGNLIVQNKIGVASSTPFSAVAVGAGGAITTTEKSLTDSSTITIDWTQGNQQLVVLGGNRTIAFTNYIPGAALRLVACQDATGSRTLTWPAAVLWNSGTSPTLTTTASKCDVLTFIATSATGTVKILGTSVLNF